MTQTISQTTIKQFRKAFPEMAHYSDVEAIAYCKRQRKQKKRVVNFIERKIKNYK